MVSVAIIGGVFSTLLSLQSQSISSFQRVRDNSVAVMISEDYMERLRMQAAGFEPVDPINPAVAERYPDYTVEGEEMDISEGEIPLEFVPPSGWALKKWRVAVQWGGKDGGEPLEFAIVRYLAVKDSVATQ